MDLPTALDELDELRRLGLLIPLFRADGEGLERYIVNVPATARSDLADYARAGQLRDPDADVDPSKYPIEPPRHTEKGRFWDGYYYAHWQLLTLRYAQNDLNWHRQGAPLDQFRGDATRLRRQCILLSALAPRYLPGIWGQVSLPGGGDFSEFSDSRFDIIDKARIQLAGVKPGELLGPAELLLSSARTNDPMIEWWPLIRHSNYSGWGKLAGASLYALWQRIAAEVLLRAHEHLAAAKLVDPLPAETEGHFRKPLYDRISAREADGLDQALGSLGLSPYPRVMLIVEGDTELLHVSRLLEEFDIDRPNRVRVLNLQVSKKNPRDLARYVTTPRLSQVRSGRQFLASTPTAVYIAMDPENLWKSEESRSKEKKKIQAAIRDDIVAQGATISQDELDMLVHVFTWGEHSYELANFTDDQLVLALTKLAEGYDHPETKSPTWGQNVRDELQKARAESWDIKIALDRLHIRDEKIKLAELQLPDLLAQLSQGSTRQSPVVEMVKEVHDLVHRLSGGSYMLVGEN